MVYSVSSQLSVIYQQLNNFHQLFVTIDSNIYPEKLYIKWIKCKNLFAKLLPHLTTEEDRTLFSNMSIRILCSYPDISSPELKPIIDHKQFYPSKKDSVACLQQFAQTKIELSHQRYLNTYQRNQELQPYLIQYIAWLEKLRTTLPIDPNQLKEVLFEIQDQSLQINIALINSIRTHWLQTSQGLADLVIYCKTKIGVPPASLPDIPKTKLSEHTFVDSYLQIRETISQLALTLFKTQNPFLCIAKEPNASDLKSLVEQALPTLIFKYLPLTHSFSEWIHENKKKIVLVKCTEKNDKTKFIISIPIHTSNIKIISARFSIYPATPQKTIRIKAYRKCRDNYKFFLRELKIWKQFLLNNVPNIPAVKFYYKKNSQQIKGYTSPWAPLRDLYQYLSTNPWPIKERIQIALQITSSLKAIHALDRVHLDLKSQNVLLISPNKAQLIDFEHSLPITDKNHFTGGWGTRPYTPPEQFSYLWTPITKMDIWSLGIIFFEIFSMKATNPFLETYKTFKDSDYENSLQFPLILQAWKKAHTQIFEYLIDQGPIPTLIKRMLAWSPSERPEASEVFEQLQIIDTQTNWGLKSNPSLNLRALNNSSFATVSTYFP